MSRKRIYSNYLSLPEELFSKIKAILLLRTKIDESLITSILDEEKKILKQSNPLKKNEIVKPLSLIYSILHSDLSYIPNPRSYKFCVACLKTDEVPYIRKYWRNPFNFGCPKHKILLNIACFNCHLPLKLWLNNNWLECYNCDSNLLHETDLNKLKTTAFDFQDNIANFFQYNLYSEYSYKIFNNLLKMLFYDKYR